MRRLIVSVVCCLTLSCVVQPSCQHQYEDSSDDYPIQDAPDDEIKNLPGLNDPINFRQFSGYLKADGENNTKKFFHYWFVESQSDPAKDPVILWLNGGPGCSSLGGLFTELGPFSVNEDGKTLKLNGYSWNKIANVLFLESPSEVGFSFSTNTFNIHTDDSTAHENHQALKSFMQKFPQYKNSPLYLAGESYGGVYLPTLGELVDADKELNLKGIAIGNGYFDIAKLTDSLIFFAYHHGLVGQSTWDAISKHCCGDQPPSRETCNFSNSGLTCRYQLMSVEKVLSSSGLNPYNLYGKCLSAKLESTKRQVTAGVTTKEIIDRNLMMLGFNTTATIDDRPFHVFDPRKRSIRVEPPCFDDHLLINYLNSPEVRSAIHIPKKVQAWDTCSLIVYVVKYPKLPGGLAPQMKKLINSPRNLTLLVYNGDVDTVCNFLGDEWFVDDLNQKVIMDYAPWRVANQIAGFVKHYQGITFATVRGSGHMVPSDRPREAFTMISKFLNAKDGNLRL